MAERILRRPGVPLKSALPPRKGGQMRREPPHVTYM
jgi:hypothetical protein